MFAPEPPPPPKKKKQRDNTSHTKGPCAHPKIDRAIWVLRLLGGVCEETLPPNNLAAHAFPGSLSETSSL